MIDENPSLLQFADYFYLIFHTGLILFNLFGWIWKPLRKWHFATISLTFASWILLGIWYGWGYCFLTDWHWDILVQLGERELPNSYISYLLQRLLGIQVPNVWVDGMTLGLALLALAISVKVNFFLTKKRANDPS
jgi:hypothetical protein